MNDHKELHAELVERQRTELDAVQTLMERQAVLKHYEPLIARANSAMQEAEIFANIQWHTAPDGSPCCCTVEDRRYGCGCR